MPQLPVRGEPQGASSRGMLESGSHSEGIGSPSSANPSSAFCAERLTFCHIGSKASASGVCSQIDPCSAHSASKASRIARREATTSSTSPALRSDGTTPESTMNRNPGSRPFPEVRGQVQYRLPDLLGASDVAQLLVGGRGQLRKTLD